MSLGSSGHLKVGPCNCTSISRGCAQLRLSQSSVQETVSGILTGGRVGYRTTKGPRGALHACPFLFWGSLLHYCCLSLSGLGDFLVHRIQTMLRPTMSESCSILVGLVPYLPREALCPRSSVAVSFGVDGKSTRNMPPKTTSFFGIVTTRFVQCAERAVQGRRLHSWSQMGHESWLRHVLFYF